MISPFSPARLWGPTFVAQRSLHSPAEQHNETFTGNDHHRFTLGRESCISTDLFYPNRGRSRASSCEFTNL